MKTQLTSFLLLIFGVVFNGFSQSQTTQLEVSKLAVDTLFFSNQVEALELSEQMLPLAFQIEDTFYITYFLDQAGELNRMLGNYDKAIYQISECLPYKENWEDLRDHSLSYNNLGKAYSNKGLYELAALNFIEALKLMEKGNDLIGQAYYLNNLGALYDLQHNYAKAITYYERSLKIKEQLEDHKGIAATNTNLGISYYNLNDFNKALHYYDKAISIQRELQNQTKLARALSNKGKVYLKLNQNNDAQNCLFEAYSLIDNIEDSQLKINLINNISEFYLHANQPDSAMHFNNLALDIALNNGGLKPLRDIYTLRSNLFSSLKEFESAYKALSVAQQYDDSLINEANIYATAEMEGKYNYEKNLRIIQEKELEKIKVQQQLDQKRVQVYGLMIILIPLAAFLIIFVILYQNKRKKNALLEGQNMLIEERKKSLEQINKTISEEIDALQISIKEKEQLLENVFNSSKEKTLPPELLSLSKREMEVLSYLALGRTDDQIAEGLFISKSTVKTHLRRIYSKLLVSGRTEAVAIAHKYELLGAKG